MIDYIIDTNDQHLSQVTTSPHKLILHDPARCIHNNDNNDCDSYYIKEIMLGQEVVINGCVLDYYNNLLTSEAQLLNIESDNGDHNINSSENVLVITLLKELA